MVVTLIGMPGSGKTSAGRALAAALGWAFTDTDELVVELHGLPLKDMVATGGEAALRRAEREAVRTLPRRTPCVIATGGSVVYSKRAMAHLRRLGPVVWLTVPPDILSKRIGDPHARGVLMGSHLNIASLAHAREPLYARYATHVVDARGPVGDVVALVREKLSV